MLLLYNQNKLYKILYFFNLCVKTLNTNQNDTGSKKLGVKGISYISHCFENGIVNAILYRDSIERIQDHSLF